MLRAGWSTSKATASTPHPHQFPICRQQLGVFRPDTHQTQSGCREKLCSSVAGSSTVGSSKASSFELHISGGKRKAPPERGFSKAFRDQEISQPGSSFLCCQLLNRAFLSPAARSYPTPCPHLPCPGATFVRHHPPPFPHSTSGSQGLPAMERD